MSRIESIYLALFDRPADPTGLSFFNALTDEGADLTPILNTLATTEEFQNRFGGDDNAQIITEIYRSLFNRDPEAAGLQFFLDGMADGSFTIETIAVAIFDGAQNSDRVTADNKLLSVERFLERLDQPLEQAAYVGMLASDFVSGLLNGSVTEEAESIPTVGEVDDIIGALLSGPPFVKPEAGDGPDGGQAPDGGGDPDQDTGDGDDDQGGGDGGGGSGGGDGGGGPDDEPDNALMAMDDFFFVAESGMLTIAAARLLRNDQSDSILYRCLFRWSSAFRKVLKQFLDANADESSERSAADSRTDDFRVRCFTDDHLG